MYNGDSVTEPNQCKNAFRPLIMQNEFLLGF